jgi:sugar transferase (PEP-CTERM/EpsH1 system associated)
MNVLFLTPFPPMPEISGSRIRSMSLLRSLSGHRVTLIACREADEAADLQEIESSVAEVHLFPRPRLGPWRAFLNHFSLTPLLAKRFIDPALEERIRMLSAEQKFSLVICETLLMNEYLRHVPGAKRVLDEHNLEFIRARRRIATTRSGFRKLYYSLIAWRLRRYELKAISAVDLCLACSAEDAAIIGRVGSTPRVAVVANTVDPEYFRPLSVERNRQRIVFTGTMWYEPNVDAMRFFCRDILPRIREKHTGASLVIAGDRPADEILFLGREAGVTVTGFVDDIRPWLAGSAVFVAPLRMGSGTRLKILAAMAMGVPVVSTSIGAEGIAAQDGLHIRIADDPGDFAAAVLDILANPEASERLARAGRKLVQERYSTQALDLQLRRLWADMAPPFHGTCPN